MSINKTEIDLRIIVRTRYKTIRTSAVDSLHRPHRPPPASTNALAPHTYSSILLTSKHPTLSPHPLSPPSPLIPYHNHCPASPVLCSFSFVFVACTGLHHTTTTAPFSLRLRHSPLLATIKSAPLPCVLYLFFIYFSSLPNREKYEIPLKSPSTLTSPHASSPITFISEKWRRILSIYEYISSFPVDTCEKLPWHD